MLQDDTGTTWLRYDLTQFRVVQVLSWLNSYTIVTLTVTSWLETVLRCLQSPEPGVGEMKWAGLKIYSIYIISTWKTCVGSGGYVSGAGRGEGVPVLHASRFTLTETCNLLTCICHDDLTEMRSTSSISLRTLWNSSKVSCYYLNYYHTNINPNSRHWSAFLPVLIVN